MADDLLVEAASLLWRTKKTFINAVVKPEMMKLG